MENLIEIPLSISTGSGYAKKSNDTMLLNLVTFPSGQGAKSASVIVNTEGSLLVATTKDTIWGIYEFKNDIYAVTSTQLLKLENAVFKEVAIVSFGRDVSICDNGTSIMMVAGNGYAYTPDTMTIKDMKDEAGWYESDTVAYMDGYFIFNRTGTGQFFISKLFSTELNPIDWATAEAAPDDTLAVFVVNRQLWLLGEKTSEIWYDSGNADFPFLRISGAVIDIGVATHTSIAKVRDSLFFVGNDFKVYATQGYTPMEISTPAIEMALDEGNTSQIHSFTFNNEGHWYYVLHINRESTFVYDLTTNLWHKRTTSDMGKWMIDGAINRFSHNAPVGYHSNKFYSLSIKHYLDDGIPIKRQMISPPINKTVNRFTLHEVMLDMEVSKQTDAEVVVNVTGDGGRTWSNRHVANLGKDGHHLQRVRWLRLGRWRDCSLRFTITDPVDVRILSLHARLGR